MKTTIISEGITLTATRKTTNRITTRLEQERKRVEDEQFFFNQLQECRKVAEETGDWDVYSDLYKDYYGVRPRWGF